MSTPPLWFKRIIVLGDYGPDVIVIKRKLGLTPEGVYDRTTRALVMGMAKRSNVSTEGEVNGDVAVALGPAADDGIPPEWFKRELRHFDAGDDVRSLNKALGLDPGDDRFREETEAAVRRLQSANGLEPTGLVDEELSRMIGPAE